MTTELYHSICDYLLDQILGTEWEGHVYAVGGCCRDEIMGLPIKDVDLAVSLPDGGVRFAGWLYENGLTVGKPTVFPQYGTAKLNLAVFPDDEIELVQTRREKYTDRTSRNPETAFGSIKEDCFRRDLTINSLYYDIVRREYIDLTGRGIDDIRNKVLRTPADPDETFDDDPVRILRCIRFAARFGWEIDRATHDALVRNVGRLTIVSVERIRAELEKMLVCDNPVMALELLRETGAMAFVIPDLCRTYDLAQNRYHYGTVWQHTMKVVEGVPADLVLRMAALLHDIGKIRTRRIGGDGEVHFPGHERSGRLVGKILHTLRYRSDFIRKVKFLIENHMVTKRWGDSPGDEHMAELRRLQYKCATRTRFDNLMRIIDADNRAHSEEFCMPHQIDALLARTKIMVAGGSAMFGYRLPLAPSEICRIKNLKSEGQLAACEEFLMSHVFKNPGLLKEDLVRLLKEYSPLESKTRKAAKDDKPVGRKKRRNRRKCAVR